MTELQLLSDLSSAYGFLLVDPEGKELTAEDAKLLIERTEEFLELVDYL
jgi:hypothetical protein